MTALMLALVGLSVVLGASMQRITGMGFALMASPLLVLSLGARAGVQVTAVVGLAATLVVLAQVWRDVEARRALALLAAALVGILPGAWVARTLPPPVLAIVIGTIVLAATLATVASERARVFTGTRGLVAAGALSGFMNVTAAVGGPAIVLYALSTDWPLKKFVGTVQLYFLGLSIASLGAIGLPRLTLLQGIVLTLALVVGLVLGTWLSRRVPPVLARRLVVVVAVLGGLATIVKGIVALV